MLKKRYTIRAISIFLFTLSLSISVYSQEFKAGIQLGITGTQVTGDQLAGFNKAGLFGGFFVNRNFGRLGDGQLEINFIQKGSKKNAHPDKGDYVKYLLRLNYIEVPVMYKFNIKNILKIEAGVMFAYLINSKEFDIQGKVYPDPSIPYYKKYDISGFAGINYKINDIFSLSFRYSYSILAIRPKPNSVTYRYNAGQFNEVLCSSLQYNFN